MMAPMNARKIGKYWHVWFSRLEEPPAGKLISMKKIVGYPVTEEREANQVIRELRKNWHRRKIMELNRGKAITLDEYRKEYIDNRQDLSEDTLRLDDLALRSLADVVGHSIHIRAIDGRKINKFKRRSFARGLSPGGLASYLRHIRAALNQAVRYGYMQKAPEIALPKILKSLPRVLTVQEVKDVLKYSCKHDCRLYRIIKFCLWTGCRRAEILRLRWEDVSDQMCTVRGKGSKERRIFLLDRAWEAMGSPGNVGFIFTQWHKDTVSHRFKKVVDALGIRARFHDLRHTAATHMLRNGIALEVIQKILGHVDIKTTQIYAQIEDDLMCQEMQKLRY